LRLFIDEKSKQHVDSKQYSSYPSQQTQNIVPISPSNSMIKSPVHFPTRPVSSQHMSPGHCLPTGMASLEKSEHIPEIQMPSMAALDPHFLRGEQDGYTSTHSMRTRLI